MDKKVERRKFKSGPSRGDASQQKFALLVRNVGLLAPKPPNVCLLPSYLKRKHFVAACGLRCSVVGNENLRTEA